MPILETSYDVSLSTLGSAQTPTSLAPIPEQKSRATASRISRAHLLETRSSFRDQSSSLELTAHPAPFKANPEPLLTARPPTATTCASTSHPVATAGFVSSTTRSTFRSASARPSTKETIARRTAVRISSVGTMVSMLSQQWSVCCRNNGLLLLFL